ncbi:MAG: hypothetical protein R3C69_15170 [Geminicoccaceae bacterium]
MMGGLRLQFFAALGLGLVGAAVLSTLVAWHVFDRELERAFEARLRLLVVEATRVLDAGIAAGLELDRPQLLERAMGLVRVNLTAGEVIAIVDADGRVVASSNPAEIGEDAPARWLVAGDGAGAVAALPPTTDEQLVITRPVQSLFGAPAGLVVARLPAAVLEPPRRALIAKISLTTALVTALGLLAAAAAAIFLPWRAQRAARALGATMATLYEGIGKDAADTPAPAELPPAPGDATSRFAAAVAARDRTLAQGAAAIDALDEAA